MSLAWATVAILVLLLPGFLFSVALSLPENFTRETVAQNPLSQLIRVLSISTAVHGALFLIVRASCGTLLPCVDLGILFALLQLEGAAAYPLPVLAADLTQYAPWILAYVGLSALLGYISGTVFGYLVVTKRRPFIQFAHHPWVYDLRPLRGRTRPSLSGRVFRWLLRKLLKRTLKRLSESKPDSGVSQPVSRWFRQKAHTFATWVLDTSSVTFARSVTFAHVLSRIEIGDRRVIYGGFLEDFGLNQSGTFAYLMLAFSVRGYMEPHADKGTLVPDIDQWVTIEGTGHSRLYLEGSEIENVVFDRKRYTTGAEEREQVLRALSALSQILKQSKAKSG